MIKRFFVAGLILLSVGCAFGKEPVFPTYSGFVNDFAGVIDTATKEKLEGLCRSLEQKTSAEMAIATVQSVEPLDPKEYAVALFKKWGIGKKGKDNGLLLLLAMDQKRIEIEVGYGLEGIIPDAKAGEILDRYVIPSFKEGKFGEGLYNGAEAIAGIIAQSSDQTLEAEYQGPAKQSESGKKKFYFPTIIAAIVIIILFAIFASGLAAGLFGAIFGAIWGFVFAGIIGAIIGAIVGFVLSYIQFPGGDGFGGGGGGFWGDMGGGGWGEGGGGFGGFGGGGSGGGGSGRNW